MSKIFASKPYLNVKIVSVHHYKTADVVVSYILDFCGGLIVTLVAWSSETLVLVVKLNRFNHCKLSYDKELD